MKEIMTTYSLISYLPIIGRTRINFYESASEIYDIFSDHDEFNRLKKVKHLGLMSRIFDSSNHTRYEYLMLQCSVVDLIDSLNKGASQVTLGAISLDGKKLAGNGLLKSWFMLSNFGHCFNTFGDSKSIMLHLLQNKSLKSTFLNVIKDTDLRKWSRSIIESYDYRKFNYVISIYRLYKKYYRSPKKTPPLKYLKLLLLPELDNPHLVKNWPKLNQLRRVFYTARDISILAIDGHYTHTPISVEIVSLISSMNDSEHVYNENSISQSLRPLLAILNEDIYLDKNVISLQRSYEINAVKLLGESSNFDSSILKALNIGLVDHFQSFVPFFRLKLSPISSLYDDLRRVQVSAKGCPNIELTIDQNFYQGHRYLDVLANFDKLQPSEISTIYFQLSDLVSKYLRYNVYKKGERFNYLRESLNEKIKKSGADESLIQDVDNLWISEMTTLLYDGMDELLTPSYRTILYSILSYVFKSNFSVDLEETNSGYKSFDFVMGNFAVDAFNHNFELAKEKNSSNVDRCHEIKVLQKQIRGIKGKTDHYVYTCIDRLEIVDITASPAKRKYTDLDGVVLFVTKGKARLEILEAKNTRTPEKDAKNDINKKLIPALNKARIKGYKVVQLKNKGAKLVINF